MKKVFFFIAIATATLFNSCSKTEDSKLDTMFNEASLGFNSIMRENPSDLNDFWWDSKDSTDVDFNRIRICKPSILCLLMEKRPYPFKDNVPVKGFLLERRNGVYVLEESYFENNKEVIDKRINLTIRTSEEMEKALVPFLDRLSQAREVAQERREREFKF